MNWKDVASTVGAYAPAIGGALGGSAGAAVGTLAATALGVEDNPEAVANAVKNDPEAQRKILELQNNHKEEITRLQLEAETTRLSEINKTMRAETESDNIFKSGWRPALGWVFTASMAGMSGTLMYALVNDISLINDESFMTTVTWLTVTVGGALGINIRERSKDKAMQKGFTPKSFMDSIIKK